MANEEHFAILRKGVDEWNRWRSEKPDIKPDLSEANLENAALLDVNLTGANLHGARLGDAYLYEATLRGANLERASLLGANLGDADLSSAKLQISDLRDANLSRVTLTNTNLSDADLRGTNFRSAYIHKTQFVDALCADTQFDDVDLSTAHGLQTIEHQGPSTIGIDTLYKSRGNIPREFLEGCGVPEVMIEFAKSLVGKPIEYYSCFISHSSQDAEFCDRLAQQMKSEKLRVWYAPEDMKGGEKVYTQIDEAIRLHDKLVLVLSEASMNSKWVRLEIQRALKREKAEKRRVLFPITLVNFEALKNWELVASDGMDLAEEIREYFIPDFSQWKDHDLFMAAFQKLLADLRTGE